MDSIAFASSDRVKNLIQSLDCIDESDLCLLANITPNTAETWRKRGKGPAYALICNRYLYPRSAVAAFLKSQVRARRPAQDARELL